MESLTPSARLVLLGQICLFAALVICYLILPQYLPGEGGASNYGIHWPTVVPYSLGLSLAGILVFRASRLLPDQLTSKKLLEPGLAGLGLLYFAVLLSTYEYNSNFLDKHIHVLVNYLVASYAFAFGLVLALLVRTALVAVLFLLQVFGTFLLILNVLGRHLLFVGQHITGLAFGILLIVSVQELTTPNLKNKTDTQAGAS